MPLAPTRKPQLFTKVINILKQLTSTRGFTVNRITNELATHLKLLGINRENRDIKLLVEEALKYGVKNKLLLLKSGKFHITVSRTNNRKRRKPIRRRNKSKENKFRRVRFKRGKTDIRKALQQTSSKSSRNASRRKKVSKSRKSNRKSKSGASKTRCSRATRDKARPKKRLKKRKLQSSSSGSYTKNNEENPDNSNNKPTEPLVESKDSKEPLNVSSEADTHGTCRNKNRNRGKLPNVMEPPRLESESEEKIHPPSKFDKKKSQRYKSRVHKDIKHRYKCCHHRHDGRSRLKEHIPDERTYKKLKCLHGKHRCEHKKCKEKLDFDEQMRHKHKHKCGKHCHCNSHEYLLEHERPNILQNHKSKSNSKSRSSMQKPEEKISPLEAFLQENQEIIEDLEQTVDTDETIESQIDEEYGISYIN